MKISIFGMREETLLFQISLDFLSSCWYFNYLFLFFYSSPPCSPFLSPLAI